MQLETILNLVVPLYVLVNILQVTSVKYEIIRNE
jgi:hypothetical protein